MLPQVGREFSAGGETCAGRLSWERMRRRSTHLAKKETTRSTVVGSWSVPSILAIVCCSEYRMAIHASSAAIKTFASFSFCLRLERGPSLDRLRKRRNRTTKHIPEVMIVMG